MTTEVLHSLDEVTEAEWDALVPERHPFLRHAFLRSLERYDCLGERSGWLPWHLVQRDGAGRLLAASPLYLKNNSYGEFVFDWGWADAYRRHGLAYYPKFVSAVPFSPVTAPKLLIRAGADRTGIVRTLIDRAREEARVVGASSVHWLFPPEAQSGELVEGGLHHRLGCQFHWHNAGYRDFQDFLEALSSRKRKNIRRERRQVVEARVELEVLDGRTAVEADWATFHRFYRSTFSRLGGHPTLTLPFFLAVAERLPDQVMLVLARRNGRPVAGALSLVSDSTLYGRHWGCSESLDSLHFEACYYQGIEYCIRRGLARFEPGAQGEHKVSRGFLPVLTHSAHWLAHPAFSTAVGEFLARERPAVQSYARDLMRHSPYRVEEVP